ncbi:MAG: DHH family phosphoesterase [Candidatus Omnitrophota bacterium]|nr:DHH family phosphoesterase [Candidatus Omnitrophota bacterium]
MSLPTEHARITKSARKIIRFFAKKKESLSPLLILAHNFPDPDALASAYALQYLAEHFYGVQSRIVYGGIIGRMENRAMVSLLKMPIHKIRSTDLKKYSNVAIVDSQPAFDNNPFPKQRRATMVIDQHPSVTKPLADLAVIDSECGATSVILAQCLLLHKLEIPVKVATALAYGILSDTLNLYRSKNPEVIDTYLKILSCSDLQILAQIQNPTRSRRFFSTLGKAIQTAMVTRDLIVGHLGNVENPDLVSQIADFFLTYQGMKWSFCSGRYKGKLQVSLRIAKANQAAGEILRDIFSDRGKAGGHDLIAGGSFKVGMNVDPSVWQRAEEELTSKLLKRLRISAKKEFKYPFRQKNFA